MSAVATPGGEVLVRPEANLTTIRRIADARELLYKAEQQRQGAVWPAAEFEALVDIAESEPANPIRLQVCDTLARYAVKFSLPVQSRVVGVVLELCADGDSQLRQHGLRYLPFLCRCEAVEKVAAALMRMKLRAARTGGKDESVDTALERALVADPRGMVAACFRMMNYGSPGVALEEQEELRECAINHLAGTVATNHADLISRTEGLGQLVQEESVKVLRGASRLELQQLLGVISKLGAAQGQGPQAVVDLLESLLPSTVVEVEHDATCPEDEAARAISIVDSALCFLKRGATDATLCLHMVSRWIASPPAAVSNTIRVTVFHRVAELARYCRPSAAEEALRLFYPAALASLPEPSDEGAPDPEVNFTMAECVMHILVSLGRRAPAVLQEVAGLEVFANAAAAKAASTKLVKRKDELDRERPFRDRILLVHRLATGFLPKLEAAEKALLSEPSGSHRRSRLAKVQQVALSLRAIVALSEPLADPIPFFPPEGVACSWWTTPPALTDKDNLPSALKKRPVAASPLLAPSSTTPPARPPPAPSAGRDGFSKPVYSLGQ
eukprot:Hpha_TRINITY_DN30286_c0_g1::TRINITY_DN30286_c0_g1_i1::g.27196::m.27196